MSADTAGQIERVDIYRYDLTYVHGDYVMSSGRVVRRLASTVVRVTTREGTTGFGEVRSLGTTYLPAHAEGARAAVRELARASSAGT
jgi:cis-L-3-hydroxyproline dehydratase